MTNEDTSLAAVTGADPPQNRRVVAVRQQDEALQWTLKYEVWDSTCKRLVTKSLFLYQPIITNPQQLNAYERIFSELRRRMGKNVPEDVFIGWWQESGRKVYSRALNQKRQTLSNNIKLTVMKKLKVWKAGGFQEGGGPPNPRDLFRSNIADGKTVITGLRENGDAYISFLRDFGKTVYGKKFDKLSKTRALNKFFPGVLEAFLLIAYENGYARWKQEVLKGPEEENTVPFKFTSSAKGSRCHEGWGRPATQLYTTLYETIGRQRIRSGLGSEFDRRFMISGQVEVVLSNGRDAVPDDWGNFELFNADGEESIGV
ncbi:unnamed protein product [Cylindrotheca closterium]|uniref:Uncharacterized protein n=1 Tax=Cylindrotheca closterium TaxID=2856 RepID=A0AAD2FRW4_9STRA|nr:unnamed protein product [Cylindrotheca closterium]